MGPRRITPLFRSPGACALLFLTLLSASIVPASDLVTITAQTRDRYVPEGKEVDAIHGDFALANNQIIAVVARPLRGRHANLTVREVGGALIDLTRRDRPSDQLSAFYPGAQLRDLRFAGVDVEAPEVVETASLDNLFVKARRVTLRLAATPREQQPDVQVAYTLENGWPYILITTTFTNRSDRPLDVDLVDSARADRSFERSPEAPTDLFWAYDRHFGQAYGLMAEGHQVATSAGRSALLRYQNKAGQAVATLAPGASYQLTRKVIPGAHLLQVQALAAQLAGQPSRLAQVHVTSAGSPVAAADVTLHQGETTLGTGRTDVQGTLELHLPPGATTLTVTEPSRGTQTLDLKDDTKGPLNVDLPAPGLVVAHITDVAGKPTPCKVRFSGRDGTPDPDFGPDSADHAVKNLVYSHNGHFRRELPPGAYDVSISLGPEYDAVFTTLNVPRGHETPLAATLVRTVETPGWISADFHSHSSPSGDNTSSQLGRVLNLLCEHVEFAPCTEHNRVATYEPHLKALGVADLMATCAGIELTGKPLPLNHQNAFPLVLRPGEQDGGGPTTDDDPAIQIERLALWDGASEKLVQVNHPDLGWMFFDRDGDSRPDTGFNRMVPHMDAIEVHPPHEIFKAPAQGDTRTPSGNLTILNWLQLLNQGHRIPGVVNTDAHYNFHGSGWLRNYLKSPTDNPAQIKTIDMVHASENGQIVMSTGPFMEVALSAGTNGSAATAGPGEDLKAPGGAATLHVRVQCPNWFDVDRVQVFVNGRPVDSLNFTRSTTADRFQSEGALKFDQRLPILLDADAHVIVATIGEHSALGPVMGPDHANDLPVAVSNPIFVDVDGGGFKPNKDPLGTLPVKTVP